MRVRLVQISTRRPEVVLRRERELDIDALTIGRDTDNELVLSALTVSLHHAALRRRGRGIVIESCGTNELRVNGARSEKTAAFGPGDRVRIGPFELRGIPAEASEDLAIEVEEVEQRSDEIEELAKRTRMGIEAGLLARRPLAWAAGGFLVLVFLAGPLERWWGKGAWNSGPLANSHAFIGDACAECHEPFQRVADAACLRCHSGIGAHATPEATPAALTEARCASCHRDHNGDHALANAPGPLCETCHEDLRRHFPKTGLGGASDFHSRHPEFDIHDAREPDGAPRSQGLRFNHLIHVARVDDRPNAPLPALRCDGCHRLDAGGFGFEDVRFEANCQGGGCHELTFDQNHPEEHAIHGAPAQMRIQLERLYAGLVLEGKVEGPRNSPLFSEFIVPGKELSEEEKRQVRQWARAKVAEAELELFGQSEKGCAQCHELSPGSAADGGMGVTPVEVVGRWLPGAEFRHVTHAPFPCASCHPGAAVFDPKGSDEPEWAQGRYVLATPETVGDGVLASTHSSDLLIPRIDTCQECHGGADASPPLVSSPCSLCHPFHRQELGPFRKNTESVEFPFWGPGVVVWHRLEPSRIFQTGFGGAK